MRPFQAASQRGLNDISQLESGTRSYFVLSGANREEGFNSLGERIFHPRASHNFLFRKDLKGFVPEVFNPKPWNYPSSGDGLGDS